MIEVSGVFFLSSKLPLVFLAIILGLSNFFYNRSLIFEDVISVLDLLYPVNYKIKVRF